MPHLRKIWLFKVLFLCSNEHVIQKISTILYIIIIIIIILHVFLFHDIFLQYFQWLYFHEVYCAAALQMHHLCSAEYFFTRALRHVSAHA
jgi:hypothetical protein